MGFERLRELSYLCIPDTVKLVHTYIYIYIHVYMVGQRLRFTIMRFAACLHRCLKPGPRALNTSPPNMCVVFMQACAHVLQRIEKLLQRRGLVQAKNRTRESKHALLLEPCVLHNYDKLMCNGARHRKAKRNVDT